MSTPEFLSPAGQPRLTPTRRTPVPPPEVVLATPPAWKPLAPDTKVLAALPEPDARLHLLCPSGIGDFLWIWSKWQTLAKTRPVTFWFPGEEPRRADQMAALVGADCGYLPGLRTTWVWEQPGEPAVPEAGGVLAVQANRHLEAGHRLETWYAAWPLSYPHLSIPTETQTRPYVLAFLASEAYMGGNLSALAWAQLCRHIEATIAPVRLVAGRQDARFAQAVLRGYPATIPPLLERPLAEVLAAASGAVAMLGVAGGPIIAAQMLGLCPTLIAYPAHLAAMPGSWEREDVPTATCLINQVYASVLSGRLQTLVESGGRLPESESAPLLPARPAHFPAHVGPEALRAHLAATRPRENGD